MMNSVMMNPGAPSVLSALLEERQRAAEGKSSSIALIESCEAFLNAEESELS